MPFECCNREEGGMQCFADFAARNHHFLQQRAHYGTKRAPQTFLAIAGARHPGSDSHVPLSGMATQSFLSLQCTGGFRGPCLAEGARHRLSSGFEPENMFIANLCLVRQYETYIYTCKTLSVDTTPITNWGGSLEEIIMHFVCIGGYPKR